MRAIPLCNRRGIAIVDDDDFYFLSRYSWYLTYNSNGDQYAKTFDLGDVYMHDLIMMPIPPLVVMHLDNIGLHNFRQNLRVATQSENVRKSDTWGITETREGNYRVRMTISGNRTCLGTYETIEEARTVRDRIWQESLRIG